MQPGENRPLIYPFPPNSVPDRTVLLCRAYPDRIVTNLYDEVDYTGFAYPDTHPRSSGAIGRVFGMNAIALPSSCRVLEIGCGDGANLISMAYGLPGSEFTGIDLSTRAIGKGLVLTERLCLSNVRLIASDLLNIDADALGSFDYIIAHGFYSWVPPDVRDRLMQVLAQCLSPAGIVFLSYNTNPGFFLRGMLRSILELHTRSIKSPGDKIAQAKALAEYLSIGDEGDGPERLILRTEAERILNKKDGTVFHDDLAAINTPVYFHELVEHAAKNGLAFLSEAGADAFPIRMLPEKISSMISGLDRLTAEQYRDFFLCRRYRQSLLVKQNNRLIPQESIGIGGTLWFSAPLIEKSEEINGAILYRNKYGAEVRTHEQAIIDLLDHLIHAWPAAVRFEDLMPMVKSQLPPDVEHSKQEQITSKALFNLVGLGIIQMSTEPPILLTQRDLQNCKFPRASALAREQIKERNTVTNLWHETVSIDNPFAARLLTYLDGTRSLHQLTKLMQDQIPNSADNLSSLLKAHLRHFTQLALLQP